MPELRILGLMSGTSLDGIDGAFCRCTPNSVKLDHRVSGRLPAPLRRRLEAAAKGTADLRETARLHHDLGRFYARFAMESARLLDWPLDAAGLHGQTVFHDPDPRRRCTLQLGEPAYLAQALGVPVVANFRTADLAAGGQGAPLATLFHRVAFARRGKSVAVQNLGGIANVTYLAPGQPVMSFDTGPANLLMDLAMSRRSSGLRRFDRNGSLARRGSVDPSRLALWMADPFLRRKPPKSTGRERYGESFLDRHDPALSRLSPEDLLATLAEFTAASVALNHRLHLPEPAAEVILCGGGVANGWLVERLRHHLGALGSTVVTCEQRGWPRQAVEPAAFALLAAYRLWELPGNLPETTGASQPVRLGQVSLP